jgi:hypothetical protein
LKKEEEEEEEKERRRRRSVVVVHTCNPSIWEAKTGELKFQD